MKTITIDPRRRLVIPGDKEATTTYATIHWVGTAQKAIQEKGSFFVALSGGSTPKEIFRRLATEHKMNLDWSKVHLYWSDERNCLSTDLESNYHMAMVEAGLKTLPIKHIFRMEAEGDLEAGAKKYETLLPNSPFDLVMLGMGEDGHTASLFPHTKALHEERRLVVPNHVPQKDTWRMTFTYPLINQAKLSVFYVLGASKQEPLSKVLAPNANFEEFPSYKVGTPHHPALWLCDEAAASTFTP
jgi:6-phosphogluconolactonase